MTFPLYAKDVKDAIMSDFTFLLQALMCPTTPALTSSCMFRPAISRHCTSLMPAVGSQVWHLKVTGRFLQELFL